MASELGLGGDDSDAEIDFGDMGTGGSALRSVSPPPQAAYVPQMSHNAPRARPVAAPRIPPRPASPAGSDRYEDDFEDF